jgi:hypothetical protein
MMVKSKTIIIEFDYDIDGVEGNHNAFEVYSNQRIHVLAQPVETRIPVVSTQRKRGTMLTFAYDNAALNAGTKDGMQIASNSITLGEV